MATTSPDNLRSPNPTDPYNLVADWAISMNDVQAALNKRGNFYVGTSTQRVAFTTAPEGTRWQDTNGARNEWFRESGAWVPSFTEASLSSALSPGWTVASSYDNSIRKLKNGLCTISTLLQAGSGGVSSIATLPAAFRPASQVFAGITRATPRSTYTFDGSVRIQPSGLIDVPSGYFSGTASAGAYYPLALTWYAA